MEVNNISGADRAEIEIPDCPAPASTDQPDPCSTPGLCVNGITVIESVCRPVELVNLKGNNNKGWAVFGPEQVLFSLGATEDNPAAVVVMASRNKHDDTRGPHLFTKDGMRAVMADLRAGVYPGAILLTAYTITRFDARSKTC